MCKIVKCECCGDKHTMSEMYDTDDGLLCGDCVTYCDNCGEVFHKESEMFEVSSGGVEMYVCDNCYMNNYWDDEDTEEE